MEKENRPTLVSLQCDKDHIIHRIGDKSYPEYRQMTVRAEDADSWEIVPAARAAMIDALNRKLDEITAYDKSPAVNGFTIDGYEMWLEYDERVRIITRIESEESEGRTDTTLWKGTMCFAMPIALARTLIRKLEVYAADCFDNTARHKAAVEALMESAENADAIENFDITEGYPAKPQFFTTGDSL